MSARAMSHESTQFEERRKRLRLRFGDVAELYDRARPEYAADALRWLLEPGMRRVLDLAAGTGKLTAVALGQGCEVIAVDPSEQMLAHLRARFPDVDARLGSAEHIDLPDGGLDAVLIGSALHWFERPDADHEIARVLRPGGVVGVFQNRRDKSVPWVAALNDLLHAKTHRRTHPGGRSRHEPFDATLFEAPETARFPFSQTLDADGLADLYASRSYVIDLPEPDREALMVELRTFARRHPDLAGRDTFELPYLTEVIRSIRR
jgi:ubiquinone/menaquinone biosynthesis C-methylase UbiE